MSDQISIIESFKKANGLSDQDMVDLHNYLQAQHKYIQKPVTIRQFIEGKDYLDSKGVIYP